MGIIMEDSINFLKYLAYSVSAAAFLWFLWILYCAKQRTYQNLLLQNQQLKEHVRGEKQVLVSIKEAFAQSAEKIQRIDALVEDTPNGEGKNALIRQRDSFVREVRELYEPFDVSCDEISKKDTYDHTDSVQIKQNTITLQGVLEKLEQLNREFAVRVPQQKNKIHESLGMQLQM